MTMLISETETVTRLEPPRIDAAEVRRANILARRRRPLAMPLGQGSLTLAPLLHPMAALPGEMVARLSVDGRPAAFRLPRPLIDAALATVQPGLASRGLDPVTLALVLELALEQHLLRLERLLGAAVAIESVESSPADGSETLHFACALDGRTPVPLALAVGAEDEEALLRLIERLPTVETAWGGLPVPFAVRLGLATLTVAELASLRRHDVVLLDHHRLEDQEVALVAGEKILMRGQLAGRSVTVTASSNAARAGNGDEWIMGDPTEPAAVDSADRDVHGDANRDATGLGDLPVRLAFDLGRLDVALSDLKSIAAGHVFDLGRDLSGPVDIMANGKRIGQGELVRIAGNLGVRITRMAGDGSI